MEYAVKYLIASYFKQCHGGLDPPSPEQSPCHSALNAESPEKIISEWFEKGKQLKEAFFENMKLNIENPEIENEFQKHNS